MGNTKRGLQHEYPTETRKETNRTDRLRKVFENAKKGKGASRRALDSNSSVLGEQSLQKGVYEDRREFEGEKTKVVFVVTAFLLLSVLSVPCVLCSLWRMENGLLWRRSNFRSVGSEIDHHLESILCGVMWNETVVHDVLTACGLARFIFLTSYHAERHKRQKVDDNMLVHSVSHGE